MSTVHEIQDAVSRLDDNQLTEFRAWFEEFDSALWDKQFEDDAKNGKLDAVAEKAISDLKADKFHNL